MMKTKRFETDNFWLDMHTGTPLRLYILEQRLAQNIIKLDDEGDLTWEYFVLDRFTIAEAIVQSFHFDDESHNLCQYYLQREGKTISERFLLFQQLLELTDIDILSEARQSTRLVELPLDLPSDVQSAGEKKDISSNGSKKDKLESTATSGTKKAAITP